MRKMLAAFCVVGRLRRRRASPRRRPPRLRRWNPWCRNSPRSRRSIPPPRPAPPLWHVTKGDSEVWILGMIGSVPKDVSWNQQPLAEVLQGSRAIIVPPRPDIDLLDISWFLVTHCCSFFRLDHGKLDDFLPEATKVKLAAMRESVGGDAKLYQGDEPFGAANRLGGDFAKKYEHDLRGDNPMQAVLKLARDKKVPQQPSSHFDPIPIGKELFKLTPQQQIPCLEANMADIERRVPHARPMAEAWAVGDIGGVKEHFAEPRITDCLAAAVHAFGAMQQNQVPSMVAAIDAALAKPGKTIAVVDLGPLLRKGGVLEQLEAQRADHRGAGGIAHHGSPFPRQHLRANIRERLAQRRRCHRGAGRAAGAAGVFLRSGALNQRWKGNR